MSLRSNTCSAKCRKLRQKRTQELLEILCNDSEQESSSLSDMSLSTEGSDVTTELIIESYPREYKHDDPPEVYQRLDKLVELLCRENNNFHTARISDEKSNLEDIQPRCNNQEEFIRISVDDYNDFGQPSHFRTSTPSPNFRKLSNAVQAVDTNNDTQEIDINDIANAESVNNSQLSQYYVKKEGALRRVEVIDSEVQVDLKNAWQSIKEKYFEEFHSFEVRAIK